MPVTLTVPDLARRIKLDLPTNNPEQSPVYLDLADLLETYTNEVLQYADANTPTANLNTAVARAVGYVWDSPGSWRDMQFARVLANSGAVHALNQWRDATGRGVNAANGQPATDTPAATDDQADTAALHAAIAAYLAENPPAAARRVHQIGGNAEYANNAANGLWVAFELRGSQRISDTDLFEFEITQANTNRRIVVTVTGRALNALPALTAAPVTGTNPEAVIELRCPRTFEGSNVLFGHSQAYVTRYVFGGAQRLYFSGAHSSGWRDAIARCWQTT